jgi:hypothetical protein
VQLLRAGSRAFREQTHQHISLVEADTIVLDPEGSAVILLPELPVRAVTSILVDGVPVETAGAWSEKGIIRRDLRFPRTFRSVSVTYDHGYDPVPEDVVEAVVDYVLVRHASSPGIPAGQQQAGPFMVQVAAGGATELWVDTVRRYAVQ